MLNDNAFRRLLKSLESLRHEVKKIGNAVDAVRNQVQSDKDAHASQQADKNAEPFVVKMVEGVEACKSASDKQDEADYQDRTIFWQKLTFIAVVAYALITLLIWCANKEAANAAATGAKAASRSVKLAEQSNHLGQRAWLGLDSAPHVTFFSLETGHFRAKISVSIKNFGRGPALNVVNSSSITIEGGVQKTQDASCNLAFPFVGIKPNAPVSASQKISWPQWGQVIFPNQPFRESEQYSAPHLNVMGREAFVVGCIVYRDQFGVPHWTRYCYDTGTFANEVVRNASAFNRLTLCSKYNYTDEVEAKEFQSANR